ncbi:MAG: hypothetical protein SFV23_21155 [Planctomycetaceae bacterium]|nr:hypothetical protein [Planctomycetaceae bacterium]
MMLLGRVARRLSGSAACVLLLAATCQPKIVLAQTAETVTPIVRTAVGGASDDVASEARESLLDGLLSLLPRFVFSTEKQIGNDDLSYNDPEFAPDAPWVTWLDGKGRVWICGYDEVTGELIPSDGRGTFVAEAVPLISPFTSTVTDLGTYNGPEWGRSRRGLSVYYVQGDRTLGYRVDRYRMADGRRETVTPQGLPVALGAFPSQDVEDGFERLIFGRWVPRPENGTFIVAQWLNVGGLRPPRELPLQTVGVSGPRWLPGSREIITNAADRNGISQIAIFDTATGATTLLTEGLGHKFDAQVTAAPEYGGLRVMSCLIDRTTIALYRESETAGTPWQRIRNVSAPFRSTDDRPINTTGADLFVYQGRTYLTYVAGAASIENRVCLASVDGNVNTTISGRTLGGFDPEAVISNGRLFVYFLIGARERGTTNDLHRAHVRIVN